MEDELVMILLKFSSFVSSTLETAAVLCRPVARNPEGKGVFPWKRSTSRVDPTVRK